MTWLGIVVAGILLLTAYKGFRRGFIREIVSFFFVFLALAVSWAINPYVNEFFMENTPVYEKIQESCQSFVESQKKHRRELKSRQALLRDWNYRNFCRKDLNQIIQRRYIPILQ